MKKVRWEAVNWIYVPQNWFHWQVLVNTAVNHIKKKEKKFFGYLSNY
jgi:hypothetical protein